MKEIAEVLHYFSFFNYPPTLEEIHTFLKKKTPQRRLASILQKMEEKGVITRYNEKRYTLPQYSKNVTSCELRVASSEKKIEKVRLYTKLLSFFPQIKLIGLSGSVAMMNAKEGDDVDLFVITAKNRLFTGRFIALVLAQLLRLRRKREIKDRVCLNLFFDEHNLKVPRFKQTEYVAHEVLQMKPLVQKRDIYLRFIDANKWMFDIFPNAKEIFNYKFIISNFKNLKFNKNFKLKIKNLGDYIEEILKKFQLRLIYRHKTTEIITDTQLWFFPDDFEKKIKNIEYVKI